MPVMTNILDGMLGFFAVVIRIPVDSLPEWVLIALGIIFFFIIIVIIIIVIVASVGGTRELIKGKKAESKLLMLPPTDINDHISYAMYYENLKDIEKCNYHCEKAIKTGQSHGTYAYERLIINYIRTKDWENALRIIDTIFKNERVFNEQAWKNISVYALNRKIFILKKIQRNK